MQLITTFINNPVKVAVGVLLVVLFGVIAVVQMPVELTPHVEQMWLSVDTIWPGAGPEEVEREIVYEQEKQLKNVPGMKYIVGSCRNSRARISMGFDVETDMNEALVKANTRLQQIRRYPETALEPTIYSGADDSNEIATFNVIPRPPSDQELQDFASANPQLADVMNELRQLSPPTVMLERLKEFSQDYPDLKILLPDVDIIEQTQFVEDYVAAAIGRVHGVGRIWVWGGKLQEMRVLVDPAKLATLGLQLSDIRNALRERNRDAPAGQLDEGKRKFDVRVIGRYTSAQQIEEEIVTVVNGSPVYIGDVASVELGYKTTLDSAAKHFATDCLRMGVRKEPGANILEVMRDIAKVRDDLNNGVLKKRGLLLYQSYDDTEYVNAAIGTVQLNMLLGAVLTTIVLLLFLRSGRSTLIVGLAIPVSIVGTFLCLRVLGRTLNVVSLAGMSFAIGMLVDNAVVVLENIYRHHQMGAGRFEAACRGTSEVWGATLASTLTTLAVFVPILFVREEAGQLFRDIALAISCGVGLSLIVSVVVIPTAASRFLRDERKDESNQRSRAGMEGRGERKITSMWNRLMFPIDRPASLFAKGVISLNRKMQASFSMQIVNVVLFVLGAVLLTYFLLPPVEYLPAGNRNSVRGQLVPPPGYNTAQVIDLGDSFYDRVRPHAQKDSLAEPSLDGDKVKKESVPKIVDYTYGAYMGKGYFSAKSQEPLRAGELVPFLKSLANELPGVNAYVSQNGLFQDDWGSSSRVIEVHILGPELERLVTLATTVQKQIQEIMPGSEARPNPSLEMGKPELRVIPDKVRATAAGLSNGDIGLAVDAFIDSAYADKYILNGEEIDLALVLKNDGAEERSLEEVPLSTADGTIVPLSTMADIELSSSLESIRRINRERAITINVTPPDHLALAEAIDKIENEIVKPLEENGELDGLYRIGMSGTADKLRDTWSALRMNFLVAILITYLLMAALFESWSYPLVIMVSLPLAGVGGIVGLRIVGLFTTQHLDIITMLGFVLLIGTVVNNAILIVHQALNFMRRDGQSPHEAVISSVSTRIRPIFMTTITTTFGLLPLVLINGAGAELYRGLGSVVLGGLLLSTMFTLFLVPSLFSLMHSFTSMVARKFKKPEKPESRPTIRPPHQRAKTSVLPAN